jgi:hypothetical protein
MDYGGVPYGGGHMEGTKVDNFMRPYGFSPEVTNIEHSFSSISQGMVDFTA